MTAGPPWWPYATTRLLGVIGDPVGHSLSPTLHNAALHASAIDEVYVALRVDPARLDDAVRGMGALGFHGANVTIPHKQAVVSRCDALTAEARLVGAVNTLTWEDDGRLVGDNTDAVGLQRVLRALGVVDGVVAVVLGTGGAARAVAVALGRMGATLRVVGRRADAADDVARLATRTGGAGRGVDLADTTAVTHALTAAGLVVNATPLGMAGEDLPGPFMALRDGQIAYDLVYRPRNTPFLDAATDAGARTSHGLSMLVAQAAVAFERWHDRPAPVDVMTAAVTRALTDDTA